MELNKDYHGIEGTINKIFNTNRKFLSPKVYHWIYFLKAEYQEKNQEIEGGEEIVEYSGQGTYRDEEYSKEFHKSCHYLDPQWVPVGEKGVTEP